MRIADLNLYILHEVFWISFVVTHIVVRRRERRDSQAPDRESTAQTDKSMRFSRLRVALHMAGFGLMYFGMGTAVFSPHGVPEWFRGQRLVGAAVVLVAAILVCSARACFRSWRFRAKLEKGHQLATGGPFRFIRHPIYMGFNLLALGSAIWVPTRLLWISVIAMAIAGDIRARAEESLLGEAFQTTYRDYCRRTRRFVPGIY